MVLIELLVVVGLTLVNGVLAMSELAIVSARKARLEALAAAGSRGARAALKLAEDPTAFLSTVQMGITLVGIVAGAFSGATLGNRLGQWLNAFPFIAPHGATIAFVTVVVLITYLSLVVGELVPKRMALGNPEAIAVAVARPMQGLARAGAPVIWLLKLSTNGVLRLLGVRAERDETVSEEEVRALISEGTEAGVFEPEEKAMIEGVLRLADRSARVIMTPRTEVVWADRAAGIEKIAETISRSHHSRVLVCDGSIDRPVGVLATRDLLELALKGAEIDLDSFLTPPLVVTDWTPVLRLIELFRREGVHFAVVVDEYGSTQGIVTPADVLETIAGDLPERGEEDELTLVYRADGSCLIDAMMPIDEVEDRLGLKGLAGDGYATLAGFVIDRLGHLPQVGERVLVASHWFEVIDLDGRRVDKILVTPVPADES